jgi:hypothetical protein
VAWHQQFIFPAVSITVKLRGGEGDDRLTQALTMLASRLAQIKERTMFTPHGTFSPVQLIGPLGVLLVGLLFWGWMYRDMATNEDLTAQEKQTWTFWFVLLNVFGAALYFLNVYRNQH